MSQADKINIKDLSRNKLSEIISGYGFERYRTDQLLTGLYARRAKSFGSIKGLPGVLISMLEEDFEISSFKDYKLKESTDGTLKFLFIMHDNTAIESVLIPEIDYKTKNYRYTLCISSQVGCALDCAFCATGKLKLTRNLTSAEIIDQIISAELISGKKITNIVLMGMGEPLHNLQNVIDAVDIICNTNNHFVGASRITVSTCGIVPKIYELADSGYKIKLALSLHATSDQKRQKIMPVALKWNLSSTLDAMEYYYRATKRDITYEYILFDSFNDSYDDARQLAKIAARVPSRVNLIHFHDISFTNPTGLSTNLQPSEPDKMDIFIQQLRKLGVNAFLRSSSGFDIDAACGQLAYSERG